MKNEPAIIINNVSKDFKLPHLRRNSIKSIFTGFFDNIGSKKSFEVQHALRDIDFSINKGEFFGIVGRNGSGKSTLLKILAGIYQPTKGSVSVGGKLVPFIELGVGFNPELTGRENVYLNGSLLGFSKSEINEMYDDIVDFAELERFMDQKLKNYSSGMQVRLAFSMAIRAEAEILLVDEVLAVGDADFQRKCFEYFKQLKKQKKTVVFVTHDMNAVREYCDRAILIDQSKVKDIGAANDVAKQYAQLFTLSGIDESGGKHAKKVQESERWGSGAARFETTSATVSSKKIVIKTRVSSHEVIDKLIYGVHISGQDGVEIMATNNRMLNLKDLSHIQPGDSVELTWEIMNIFNDGKYEVTLTLVDDLGKEVDWHKDATTFRVKREQRSTTAVLPPVEATIKPLTREGAKS